MGQREEQDASALGLFHFLLALLLMLLLMWGVASQFNARRQDALAASWQQWMVSYGERVGVLHGLWLSQGRPRQLFHVMAGQEGVFIMNDGGWPEDWRPMPVHAELVSPCSRLWWGVLGRPAELASQAVEMTSPTPGVCLFQLGELTARYNQLLGSVIVKQREA